MSITHRRRLLLWRLAAGINLLCAVAGASAEILPAHGPADPRIRSVTYSANEVYRLVGYAGYDLDLEFESDETFAGLSAGDPEALTYSAHDNVLSLRPKAAMVETNLTVSTSKRRYYFDYSASARRPSRTADEVMYAVRFTYPAPLNKNPLTAAEQVDAELARARKDRPRNIDYWFCGSSSIKPVAASDDGVHTRLTFAVKGELPALFVRNDDSSESLLNFSMDEGDMVIHRVAARFIVRRGKLTGCIVNKGFIGSGERLESGTIAPNVTREPKVIRP